MKTRRDPSTLKGELLKLYNKLCEAEEPQKVEQLREGKQSIAAVYRRLQLLREQGLVKIHNFEKTLHGRAALWCLHGPSQD